MIVCIYGTTAEAIKIAPVVRRLERSGAVVEHWLTYQHTESLDRTRAELNMAEPDHVIARGAHGQAMERPAQTLIWLLSVVLWVLRELRPQRAALDRGRDVVLVQGDTLTTVVGAALARLLGLQCAHVEAGLRSGDWRNPFPEELDRRIVGRLAHIHYPPSAEAARHLAGRANVIPTHRNTVVDAAADVAEGRRPTEPFGLALLHRFELISNRSRLEQVLASMASESDVPIKVIVDAYSSGPVRQIVGDLEMPHALELTPKLPYAEFISLLQSASFVVTDSGGIQQEAAYLGVPTLIHRSVTESEDGLGENVVLSEWKDDRLRSFLRGYQSFRRNPAEGVQSPSQIVSDDLVSRGFAADSE